MIEFSIIENEKEALKAVECNGDALRFVKERSLFVKIALALKIKVDIE